MNDYEQEKRKFLKWVNMIDEYILEPNSIDAEWVKCLVCCKSLIKHRLLQQANLLHKLISIEIQSFYLKMKDVWGITDYKQQKDYDEEYFKARAEYETLYGAVPEFKTIDELSDASAKIKKDIEEIYHDRISNKT